MQMKNKIGIYYAYWTKTWDADFVPFVLKVKKLGFDILEVNSGTATNMSNPERDRLKKAAEKAGIELTYCIGLPPKYDVASPNASVRKAGVAFLKKSAKMVEYMGNTHLGGIIYSSWPAVVPKGDFDKRPYLDRSIKSMKEVMKTAEDCGVQFNVEVVNRFEQFLLNTAAEGVQYVKRVGSDNCMVLLDMFHMNIEEDSIYDAIVSTGKYLGHVHVGETNRRAPGRGHMPWGDMTRALKKIRYSGAITMEPFLMTGGQVGRDISVFRDLRDGLNLDMEAKRALKFMRAELDG
jgi:D-psicose/D-tagatose/L-ribulose 3-epimerase